MAYKASIFDLDGTLADTLRSIAGFGNDTLSAFGLPPIPVEDYKQLVGTGPTCSWTGCCAPWGRSSPPRSESVPPGVRPPVRGQPMRLVTPYPGLPELLSD